MKIYGDLSVKPLQKHGLDKFSYPIAALSRQKRISTGYVQRIPLHLERLRTEFQPLYQIPFPDLRLQVILDLGEQPSERHVPQIWIGYLESGTKSQTAEYLLI